MSTSAPKTPRLKWLKLFKAPRRASTRRKKVLSLFGTRPEAIKLAPVIRALQSTNGHIQTVNVSSGQHAELLDPFVELLGIRIDHDLKVMLPSQTPNQICARVMSEMDSILEDEMPDMILVQGDTTTALAGALAGFHRDVPVGHVEAGLRSGNLRSPFPEEMNRRMISRLATFHFAATRRNRMTLMAEGVDTANIFVTGNPVVDSLKDIMGRSPAEMPAVRQLLCETSGLKRLILTTHRRERFGETMLENLVALRQFVETHGDVTLIFPVHPNPSVVEAAEAALSHHSRIHLIQPLGYQDFISLLSEAWLIVSDSGGVQEEAPTLGKPLLVLRENTERPESLESGVARLVGPRSESLTIMLEDAYLDGSWASQVGQMENPFGSGESGRQIAEIIEELIGVGSSSRSRTASK